MSDGYQIPLFALNFDEAEAEAAAETVRSGWISMGARTRELEERFAELVGTEHAVAVGSCTAALHLAMAMLVEPGDEVIVPSLTFVATANAVRYAGATPVFADIVGPDDLSLDPDDVVRRITPRTRALVVVHYGGFAAPMADLVQVAEEHGLELVEDAAHAPASRFGPSMLGGMGRIGCFSFFSNKNISCAEGGMLVTDDEALAERARLLRSHGMTTLSYDRAKGHATAYDVVDLGFNYRIDDIRASIALVQLEKLLHDTERRQRVRKRYVERLADEPGLRIPYLEHAHESSHYIMPVVLTDGGAGRRNAVRDSMAEAGVQTSVHYPPAHLFEIYRAGSPRLPRTEEVASREITLPMYGSLEPEQVDRVCDALVSALELTA